jgi:BirA family biotin operon repressor/biotin-[acetyl-CoA-carboxylase] ligase
MRDKILFILKNGDFISGEKVAKELSISRTAVWKQINVLKEMGYEIEAVKNKGYRLLSRPDMIIPEEVSFELNTKIIGNNVFCFKSISSTNRYCKDLIKKNIKEGTVVISEIQTDGRGRKNRKWISSKGGIWFSVILYPNIPPQQAMYVTMTGSISVVQGINEVTGLNPKIKWPNDLLYNGKKICGILTELDAEMDKINYSILGIGINVNNKIDIELKNSACSLGDVLNSKVSILFLLKSIIRYLDFNYTKLLNGDLGYIRKLWLSYADIIGRNVRVKGEKSIIEGTIVDISNNGSLILDVDDKNIEIISGDIEYI